MKEKDQRQMCWRNYRDINCVTVRHIAENGALESRRNKPTGWKMRDSSQFRLIIVTVVLFWGYRRATEGVINSICVFNVINLMFICIYY
ncbi:hypothetical protein, partial [Yersinia sp. 2542 StPb PI]|uniref:hypothetical protein n=1 Tax=Yersinia sp. 2542 StPb PI TaxID=3117408 RepID=UPI003B285FF1